MMKLKKKSSAGLPEKHGCRQNLPREDGEEEEEYQDRERVLWGGRCVRCFLRCFCVYSLADSGDRRKLRWTQHFGVRWGQDKERVLKLSWPSTEYRMMKFF